MRIAKNVPGGSKPVYNPGRNSYPGAPPAGVATDSGDRRAPAALLARVPLLAPLGEETLWELARSCRERRYERGEALFHEADFGRALFILLTGHVKIVRLAATGEDRILHLMGPGECLGELALVDGAPRSATAVALDRVEALVLSREEFLALIQRHPRVALAVMSAQAEIVRRLSEQVPDLTTLEVPERLAKKLLALAHQHGESTPAGLCIPLRLSQQELAEMIGATRVAVNHALSEFRRRGLLGIDHGRITLYRPEQLRPGRE